MKLSLFDYPYPKELVAQHPLPHRTDSRMMVVHRSTGGVNHPWEHLRFPDLLEFLQPGDLLVLNNAEADLIPMEGRLVPPLPPYIKRKGACDFTEEDYKRYRTIYAAIPGSKAAPTAGFHFTEEILQKVKERGVSVGFVTLHVSTDTYKPIRTAEIQDHPMHGEEYFISEETAVLVRAAKQEGGRVIAVGTTTVRALEAWARNGVGATPRGCPHNGQAQGPAPTQKTHLFITPGFQFKIVDALLTNFHRPRSTVLVMVAAFAGRELILKAYEEAIRQKYRLFSYGDCMLIL